MYQVLASAAMLDLFPETARIEHGELTVGGVSSSDLARTFGTPLLVYCEQTLRARARAYRAAAPAARVLYSVKAFPNVEIVRVLADEGLGAEVSTLGELAYARQAGVPGEELVVDGNNKADEELAAAAEAGALLVVDAADDVERAAAAGVRRVLVRVTPGIDADTHWAIATGHRGSKFGLPPEDAIDALRRCAEAGLDAEGVHVHVGSQLLDVGAARMTVDWLASFAAESRAELNWTPGIVDLGGGLGISYTPDDHELTVQAFVSSLLGRVDRAWSSHGLPQPRVVLEPGRSLVGPAGLTLYRVGVVKRAGEHVTYVAVDGGMSDNPRPQLYGARLAALLADRADEEPSGTYTVCGKHCESGDVLIERARLPEPRRGDLLAVPATGAYTLGMASNYNAVPRPAAVLVAGGQARLIRRRESVHDLLALEPS
ncbi:MAG: diaminopimelate decarboxylase [Candidatus Rokuibacteriota bacterium]|nr:MAG: diaminopimelate decarboxylase [Candidatus Rokubacteria bacterium]